MVCRRSVLPRPAVPCLAALRPSPAEPGITSSRPGATSGSESPHVGLRGLEWVGWGLFLINSAVYMRARTHTHTIWGLSATERDNDPERCKFHLVSVPITKLLAPHKIGMMPGGLSSHAWRPSATLLQDASLAAKTPALSRGPQGRCPAAPNAEPRRQLAELRSSGSAGPAHPHPRRWL